MMKFWISGNDFCYDIPDSVPNSDYMSYCYINSKFLKISKKHQRR